MPTIFEPIIRSFQGSVSELLSALYGISFLIKVIGGMMHCFMLNKMLNSSM